MFGSCCTQWPNEHSTFSQNDGICGYSSGLLSANQHHKDCVTWVTYKQCQVLLGWNVKQGSYVNDLNTQSTKTCEIQSLICIYPRATLSVCRPPGCWAGLCPTLPKLATWCKCTTRSTQRPGLGEEFQIQPFLTQTHCLPCPGKSFNPPEPGGKRAFGAAIEIVITEIQLTSLPCLTKATSTPQF